MPRPKPFHQIARQHGYRDEREMLTAMYDKNSNSIRDIAAALGESYSTVKAHLEAAGISLRAKGGSIHRENK